MAGIITFTEAKLHQEAWERMSGHSWYTRESEDKYLSLWSEVSVDSCIENDKFGENRHVSAILTASSVYK